MTSRRLLGSPATGFAAHRDRFGPVPESAGRTLVAALDRAGLTGRGGAGFPTGRKIAAVSGRKPVVIGNGAEGEPLSSKDATLLVRAPHLVLDGLQLAAAAVTADTAYLYVPTQLVSGVQAAIAERTAAKVDRCRVDVIGAPDTFVAGEESAVIRRIGGGPALPTDRTVLATTSGVRGRPTLVNNVETLAHVAVIARFGPTWFRSVGDAAQPGTMLVTLSSAVGRPTVAEIATGAGLLDVIADHGQIDVRTLRAVLIGGYHGSWIAADELVGTGLSRAGLAPFGATPGAGVLHVLRRGECGLERTAEIATYLADQSARQCGPCLNGLPRLARLLDELAHGHVDDALVIEVHRVLGLVDGRGSCRHPDGTARLVRTALRVFGTDVGQHRHGRCEAQLLAAQRQVRHAGDPT